MINTSLSFETISQLLNGPAFKSLPSQQTKETEKTNTLALKALRKVDLDNMQASESPMKNIRQTIYGECPFSLKALKWKKENDITAGRNVSIVIFRLSDSTLAYTIAATSGPPGQPHAELEALDELPNNVEKDHILAVYSERKFCCKGSNCHRKVKLAIDKENTEVVYNVHHTPNQKRQRENELEFQELQSEMGIRLARSKKSHPTEAKRKVLPKKLFHP